MKVALLVSTAVALSGAHTVGAVRSSFLRKNLRDSNAVDSRSVNVAIRRSISDSSGGTVVAGTGAIAGKVSIQATLDTLAKNFLDTGRLPDSDLSKAAQSMDVNEAMQQLDGKLPSDVASLVRLSVNASLGDGKTSQDTFSEDSIAKARKILNGMVESSRIDLDDVEIECYEFAKRNRLTFSQVKADLARFSSQLAKEGEHRVQTSECIAEEDRRRKELEGNLEDAQHDYSTNKLENERLMAIRKNDLAVFDFILNLTKCKDDGTSQLLQLGFESKPRQPWRVCNSKAGIELNFNSPALQARIERMLTPGARQALREALGQLSIGTINGKAQLLQVRQAPTTDINTTTGAIPTYSADEQPVSEEPHPSGQALKCVDGPYNCGLLHDLMSLQWGKFRDEFDILSAEMSKNEDRHEKTKANINDQLTVVNDMKTGCMEGLAEAIASINQLQEEEGEKNEQHTELEEEYRDKMKWCRKKVKEILFTNICAVRKIRNTVVGFSTISPPSKVSDCDVTDWTAAQCEDVVGNAVECDDTCPQKDPYKCGGTETITREVVVAPNEFGFTCPPLKRDRKCNQRKCPVDCVLSQWSGWSKCTAECDGGQQEQTRSILVKAKNGGEQCDTVQESRNCNTLSCYRDCRLSQWTDWGFCSMACSMKGYTGNRIRNKKVLTPTRGQGKCPAKRNRARYQIGTCNMHGCVGDEICIAQQDLVILLDASGSLRQEGFDALKAFAANLTAKYQDKFFGMDAMRVGLVLFGNGNVQKMPDGTTIISPAINVQGLTGDMSLVREKIMEQTWQRGFTNMAQAFIMADTVLQQGGRGSAQSAVLVISDGKYSMKFQTEQKAKELKDKNIMLFMAPVTEAKDEDLKLLKKWASQPPETNFERIPGLQALEYNAELFAQRILAKFCPDSVSLSALIAEENEKQYMLVHENGWPSVDCGHWDYLGTQPSTDDCAMLASERGIYAFSFGRAFAQGECYSEAVEVTSESFREWQLDRRAPPCPGGSWFSNPYFDTYLIKPRASAASASG